MALWEELGVHKAIPDVISALGNIHAALGENDRALEHYRAAIELSEQVGWQFSISENLMRIGEIHFNRGEYEQDIPKGRNHGSTSLRGRFYR